MDRWTPPPLLTRPSSASEAGRSLHALGIAGAGMQSLVRVLSEAGWQITGSDPNVRHAPWLSTVCTALRDRPAPELIHPGLTCVVASDAVSSEHAERRRAREFNLPVVSYAELLGALLRERRGVAIAGTHGKSTTAAWLTELAVLGGIDPTAVVGAAGLDGLPRGRRGDGNWCISEACEYRRNFLRLTPERAAILNVELDHFDCYAAESELYEAFGQFAERLPRDGRLVIAQGERLASLARRAPCRVETFGTNSQADWHALDVRVAPSGRSFTLYHRETPVSRVQLRVPGAHQVLNALAAAALAAAWDLPAEVLRAGLEGFAGLSRRGEQMPTPPGEPLWIDDYAHHPTEIRATLAAVREAHPKRRVWAIFQPHQASRTARLLDELAASLHNADTVAVAEIYRAREGPPRAGEPTAAQLAERVARAGTAVLDVHDPAAIHMQVHAAASPGDVIVTLGAGNLRTLWHECLERLEYQRALG